MTSRAENSLLRQRGFVASVTLFWLFVGALSWILDYAVTLPTGEPSTLGLAASRWVYAVLWWTATFVGIWLAETFTVRGWRDYGRLFFHAATGAAISVAWAAVAYYVNLAVVPGWRPEGVAKMVQTTSLMTWFFYTGMIGLVHAVIFAREYRSREVEALRSARLATEAQLQVLKMELQPHFLFNALNSVSTLMHRDVQAANEMLVLVSEMLRHALARVRAQEVTLEEEVATVQLYLRIEQIRFGDRLTVTWDVAPELWTATVPHMLLQPILENAVRHGVESRAGPGRIEIVARQDGARMQLQVRDNGRGPSAVAAAGSAGFGLGLSITRARLQQLYGEKQSLELAHAPGGGGLVRVSIPLAWAAEGSEPRSGEHAGTDPSADR